MKTMMWILVSGLLAGPLRSGWALTITPSRTDVRLAPGARKKTVLTVFNEAAEPVQVEVSEKDWFVLPDNKKFAISDWMKIHGSKNFLLKPHKKRNVSLTLTAPKGAVGELVGMTSFLYRGQEPSMITPMISVSSYLAIAGTEKVDGSITDLLVADMPQYLRCLATVTNTGNVHLRPSGGMTLLGAKGEVLNRMSIAENAPPTYPGNVRAYVGEDKAYALKPGAYTLRAELMSGGLTMTATRDFKVTAAGQIQMGDKK